MPASVNMFPYTESPASSLGAASYDATPDTKLTNFSPADARNAKSSVVELATPMKAGQHDPFVSTGTNAKTEQKLSATASAFQPFGIRSVPVQQSAESGPCPSSPVPGTADHLKDIIEKAESPVRSETEVPRFGIFTSETKLSRTMKVTSALNNQDLAAAIDSSLHELEKSGYSFHSIARVNDVGHVAYLRLSHIGDASAMLNALRKDHTHLIVECISPVEWCQAVSPQSKAKPSAFEGQVILTADYISGDASVRKSFEDHLKKLLIASGSLVAWSKVSSPQAATFHLIAEFHDVGKIEDAVARIDGAVYGADKEVVTLSLQPYKPDTIINFGPQRPLTTATPTRRSGDQDISDAMGGMSINRTSHHSGSKAGPSNAFSSPAVSAGPMSARTIQTPLNTGVMSGFGSLVPLPGSAGLVNRTPQNFQVAPVYTPQSHDPFSPYPGTESPYPSPSGMTNMAGTPITGTPTSYGMPPNMVMFSLNPMAATQQYPMINFGPYSPYNQQGYSPGGMSMIDYSNSPGMYSPDYRYQSSTAGRYRGYEDDDYSPRALGRRQNAMKVPHHVPTRSRHPNPAAGHHNHVDIDRIRQGSDVRTTVMLRNIPNKVDQSMLKEIVDESSFGCYDFMYLRIDFSNNCNVGYAFINFTDPLDIIKFVQARSNMRWHRFKSDKVAEVSYATIQGRDCLIQKFRNSSVMLEPPHYRPKLFFTTHDPYGRAGQEDDFPCSDNASKLKRSCENAEHVGLFAPSAGQHLRDEQRRRRSQYDRGTSLAEREEHSYNDDMRTSYLGYGQF